MKSVFIVLIVMSTIIYPIPLDISHDPVFDGNLAYQFLVDQCSYGPRPPGSENLSQCRQYIINVLEDEGWAVTTQNFTYRTVNCTNIIASNIGNATLVIGAHYDTRPLADQDPGSENRTKPVMGANDGASGVAVLLELARILPETARDYVELVFFDAEDSGNIDGWDWIVGSRYYVSQLSETRTGEISAMVLLDMVGDTEIRLTREISSTDSLQDRIWDLADEMGHSDTFLDTVGASILDDHRPFLDAGIPAVDIIQHNPFPWYWHTVEDTIDKCSPDSLEVVGSVVETFVVDYASSDTSFPIDQPVLLYGILVVVFLVVMAPLYLRYRRK